jgi:hypothetical protein
VADEWRVTIAFARGKQASELHRRVSDDGALAAAGGSLSDVGNNLYAYAPSEDAVKRMVAVIQAALVTLSLEPVSARVDQWIPEESRWGNPTQPKRPGDDQGDSGWMSGLIQGLIEGPW